MGKYKVIFPKGDHCPMSLEITPACGPQAFAGRNTNQFLTRKEPVTEEIEREKGGIYR
jgi:hypothetical protein